MHGTDPSRSDPFARQLVHDLRHVLRAIQGSAEMGLLELRADDRAASELTRILSATEHAQALTGEILALGTKPALRALDLAQHLRERAPLLEGAACRGGQLGLRIDLPQAWVRAAPTHLDRLLLNLVGHACRSCGPLGQALVHLGRRAIDSARACCLGLRAGVYVCVSVLDDGAGVPEDEQESSLGLEPGARAGATGQDLGLTICRDLAQQMHGAIELESPPSRGACWRLWLPERLP